MFNMVKQLSQNTCFRYVYVNVIIEHSLLHA